MKTQKVAAAVLAANRKLDDLQTSQSGQIGIIAANLVAEYNLTQEGLQAIVDLYHQYYEEVSGIYAAMQSMMNSSGNTGEQAEQCPREREKLQEFPPHTR